MHSTIHNELRLDFSITPISQLSIQARAAEPPRFVRAPHPTDGNLTIYIPGTTLKGAMRAAAEQVLRSAQVDCCTLEHPCIKRDNVIAARQSGSGAAIYRAQCSVCRLFGSRFMRSHLTVTDSFPADPLDAFAASDTTSDEVALSDPFYGSLSLRNYERWQVGLLALLLARMNMGEIQLGSSRSAGMGCVAIRYRCLSLIYPGPTLDLERQDALRANLHGVGQFTGRDNLYGFTYPDIDSVADLPEEAALETGTDYTAVIIEGEAEESHGLIDNVLTRQALAWANYVQGHRG